MKRRGRRREKKRDQKKEGWRKQKEDEPPPHQTQIVDPRLDTGDATELRFVSGFGGK